MRRANPSVLSRLMIRLAAVVIVMITLTLVVTEISSQTALLVSKKDRLITVLQTLKPSIAALMTDGNVETVQRLIEATAAASPVIDRIWLLDEDDVVLAASDPSERGRQGIDTEGLVITDQTLSNLILNSNNTGIRIHLKPPIEAVVSTEPPGWWLGFRLDPTYRDPAFESFKHTLTAQTVLFFCALTGLTLLILYRSLLRPLGDFLKAGREIAEGDYRFQMTGFREDEFGWLAKQFNQMAEVIHRRDSEIRQNQSSLWENSQRLELALKSIDAGLWDLDLTSDRLLCNDRLMAMLGRELEPIPDTGKALFDLLCPDDRSRFRQYLTDLKQGQRLGFHDEFRLQTGQGDFKWIRITGRLVTDEDEDKPQRIIGTHIDIDRQKTGELELVRYRERLEEMVATRTRELEAAQAELVSKALEAGRAQLSAMILHNIGNAITPVGVQIEEMLADQSSRIQTYLAKSYQDLQKNRSQLTDYINRDKRGRDVFDFLGKLIETLAVRKNENDKAIRKIRSAIEYVAEIISLQQNYAGGIIDNRQQVDLNTLLEDALKMQAAALEKRKIDVERQYGEKLPPLVIDKNKLMQVAVNLVKNAYEAIDAGKAKEGDRKIIVRTFIEKEKRAGFEITDTGIGIDAENAGAVFEFGHSGKGSSGFGLYYSKVFAEANHGELTLSSPGSGQGATARLVFAER
jgi:PAS domain S-box-containing protein